MSFAPLIIPSQNPFIPFAQARGVFYWLDVPRGGDRDSFAAAVTGFAAAA